jgi:hypothetical protein
MSTTTKANEYWPHLLAIAIERPLVFAAVNDDTMMMKETMMMWTRSTTMTTATMVIRSLDSWALVADALRPYQSLRSLMTFFCLIKKI